MIGTTSQATNKINLHNAVNPHKKGLRKVFD